MRKQAPVIKTMWQADRTVIEAVAMPDGASASKLAHEWALNGAIVSILPENGSWVVRKFKLNDQNVSSSMHF